MPDKKRWRFVGCGRGPKHKDLETVLLQWVREQHSNRMIVNIHRLREQAFAIAKEHSTETVEFKCCDKWISKFMKQNKLSVRKVTHTGQADNKT